MVPPKVSFLATLSIVITLFGALVVYEQQARGPQEEIPFRTISPDGGWAPPGKANLVINNQTAWQDLWKEGSCSVSPCAPPLINFTKETVLAVFAGLEPSSGYEISITGVIQEGSGLFVYATLTSPGRSCIAAQVLTWPYDIVAIPKTSYRVSFVIQTAFHVC